MGVTRYLTHHFNILLFTVMSSNANKYYIFVNCVLIILEKAAVRPAVLISLRVNNIKHAGFRRVTHSLPGISYHLAVVMHVSDVNLRTIKPQL